MVVAVGKGVTEDEEEGVDEREETVDRDSNEDAEGAGGVMVMDGINDVGRYSVSSGWREISEGEDGVDES
jgi:hypothetical protein